jgi:hypothetical protein
VHFEMVPHLLRGRVGSTLSGPCQSVSLPPPFDEPRPVPSFIDEDSLTPTTPACRYGDLRHALAAAAAAVSTADPSEPGSVLAAACYPLQHLFTTPGALDVFKAAVQHAGSLAEPPAPVPTPALVGVVAGAMAQAASAVHPRASTRRYLDSLVRLVHLFLTTAGGGAPVSIRQTLEVAAGMPGAAHRQLASTLAAFIEDWRKPGA